MSIKDHPLSKTVLAKNRILVDRGNGFDEQTTIKKAVNSGLEGWRALASSLNAAKVTGASQPDWSVFQDGVYAYEFSAGTMNESWLTFHVNHDYKLGTDLWPNIHWSTTGTDTGTVRWGMEYTSAIGFNQETFAANTTVYMEQAASGTARRHMTVNGAAMSIANLENDALIIMRVFRDAGHDNDDLTDTAFGFFIDIHYETDHYSTINKEPPFI